MAEIEGDFLDGVYGLSDDFSPKDPSLTPEEQDLIGRVNDQAGKVPDEELSSDHPIPAHLSTGEPTERKASNLALEILHVGLRVEKQKNQELQKHASEAAEIQKTIEKLIDLSGNFAVHMEGNEETVLSEEIQSMCQDLKEKGIEVLQGDNGKMSRDRMAEVKAHISSHTDRLKTDLQKKFTTEIQVKINELQSILDCLKTIEKYSSRLNSTIISNQKAH